MLPLALLLALLLTGCGAEGRGAFGSNVNHYPNGTVICDKECYDTMCAQDAEDFYTVRLLLLHSKLHQRRLKARLCVCAVGQGGSEGCCDRTVELGRLCLLQRLALHPATHMLHG